VQTIWLQQSTMLVTTATYSEVKLCALDKGNKLSQLFSPHQVNGMVLKNSLDSCIIHVCANQWSTAKRHPYISVKQDDVHKNLSPVKQIPEMASNLSNHQPSTCADSSTASFFSILSGKINFISTNFKLIEGTEPACLP
jgi:hypothetical protein